LHRHKLAVTCKSRYLPPLKVIHCSCIRFA
jgi:hypothetical protein